MVNNTKTNKHIKGGQIMVSMAGWDRKIKSLQLEVTSVWPITHMQQRHCLLCLHCWPCSSSHLWALEVWSEAFIIAFHPASLSGKHHPNIPKWKGRLKLTLVHDSMPVWWVISLKNKTKQKNWWNMHWNSLWNIAQHPFSLLYWSIFYYLHDRDPLKETGNMG